MKKLSRILCLILTLALVMGIPAFTAFADFDIDPDYTPLDDFDYRIDRGSIFEAPSYFAYLQYIYETYRYEHGRDPSDATQPFEIDFNNVRNLDSSMFSTREGREEVLTLYESDEITFIIDVPESAFYNIEFEYFPLPGRGRGFEVAFYINDEIPFAGAMNSILTRVWEDYGEITLNWRDDEVAPYKVERQEWLTNKLMDNITFTSDYYRIFLTEGRNYFTLRSVREDIAISDIRFTAPEIVPEQSAVLSYLQSAGYQDFAGDMMIIQAEVMYLASGSYLRAGHDRSSSITQNHLGEPNDARRTMMNMFSAPGLRGEWVSYKVYAEQAGFYNLGFRFRQDTSLDTSVHRDILVNGVVQSQDFLGIAFDYGTGWQYQTVSGENGESSRLFLQQGYNEITIRTSLGKWAPLLQEINEVNLRLGDLYRRIVMVTGVNPDRNRDIILTDTIPTILYEFQEIGDDMMRLSEWFIELNNGRSTEQSSALRTNANRMHRFAADQRRVPRELGALQGAVMFTSNMLHDSSRQSLQLDFLTLKAPGAEAPVYRATFWQGLVHGWRMFIASFFIDHMSMGPDGRELEDAVTVWVNAGREEAQVLMQLANETFTEDTGIPLVVSIAGAGIVEATLSGRGPDIIINMPRALPVNLAWRGALVDLTQFDTFDDVASRFAHNALVPYTFADGVYALPYTQSFFVMFYRVDLLEELGLTPPETWDEVTAMLPILQRRNMFVGLPYVTVTGQFAVEAGIGAKDMFATFLLQQDGQFYTEDKRASALYRPEGMIAFQKWTDFYNIYGFRTDYDFTTEMRTGETPISIANFEMYNALRAAAPEIRGRWNMTTMPGTRREDGTINFNSGGGGNTMMMFRGTENWDHAWQFLDWFTSDEIQFRYCTNIENIRGAGGRIATANLNAFSRLPWATEEYNVITEQRNRVVEIPEVPGGYFVMRTMDNAFRSVVLSGRNPREMFEMQSRILDDEIRRKWREVDATWHPELGRTPRGRNVRN